MLKEAVHYSRMAAGIYRYVRAEPLGDPEGVIRRQLDNRQNTFLETVRRAVFSNPRNPYCDMFRMAGCTFGDLENTVRRDGLEAAMQALHRQGVYLTHDEFKGKAPIVRSGRQIPAPAGVFRNPLYATPFETLSSGSRSKGTRTPQSLAYRLYQEARSTLRDREFELESRAHVDIKAILPSLSGVFSGLRAHRMGRELDHWFAVGGSAAGSRQYRWLTNAMIRYQHLLGVKSPMPDYLPPNDFLPVAEWIARRRSEGVPCAVSSPPSPAVRVAAAAQERGLDIHGALFLVAGEALTDPKRRVIEQMGAEVYPTYPITEVGGVGCACRQMKTGNSVHIFQDALCVISHRKKAPLSDVDVNALLFTNLLPFAGHILINAEMDDSGIIEPARCDCLYSRVGFHWKVREINSFGKLTGQGITLVGTDVVSILEESLPRLVGGAPGDYQLVEREGAAQTQLTLRVSPRVKISGPERVREIFFKELQRFYGGSLAARTWSHAEGLEVVIAEPLCTRTGKALPLHLLGTEPKHHAA